MKLVEMFTDTPVDVLMEVAVESSWISDVETDDGDVILTLLSGRQYRVHGFPDDLFELWTEVESPGRFWHTFVAGKYYVAREN